MVPRSDLSSSTGKSPPCAVGTLGRVNVATHRTDVAYIWPQTLIRPSKHLRLVYLDQAQWIYLAQAATGHQNGAKARPSLEALRALKANGSIICPLSLIHLMETSASTPRQRADLASVMEELSSFACLLPRSGVMLLELEAVLDEVRPRSRGYAPIPLIGNGTMFACGKSGRFNVYDSDGRLITDEVRSSFPGGPDEFDRIMAQAHIDLDRGVLRGPQDAAEEARLIAYGWNPRTAAVIGDERAKQEQEQAVRLSDRTLVPGDRTDYRRARVRDVVRTRHVVLELMEAVNDGLGARGLEIEDVWSSVDASRRVVDAMPSGDVAVSLLTEYHRNPNIAWKRNHIFDIDALSVAVPYCDAVVADEDAVDKLRRSGVAERLGTPVFTSLAELVASLS
jgi:hypothetical protein